jgi:hypothetical protein
MKTGEHDIDLILHVFADDDPPRLHDVETIGIVEFTKDNSAGRYFLGNQKLGQLRTSRFVQILAEGNVLQKFRNGLHGRGSQETAMLAAAALKYKFVCTRIKWLAEVS